MKAKELAETLHPLELKFFDAVGEQTRFKDGDLENIGDISSSQLRTVIEWQLAKECIEVIATSEDKWVELTELGEAYRTATPEQRMIECVREQKTVAARELAALEGLDPKEASSALGSLSKAGILVSPQPGMLALNADADISPIEKVAALIKKVGMTGKLPLNQLTDWEVEQIEKVSRKRGKSKGVFRLHSLQVRTLRFTALGKEVRKIAKLTGRSGDEINLLTPSMLSDGSWKKRNFRRYNLNISPPRRLAGRRHPYRAFFDTVRRKLTGLGFSEMRGELVESAFWNNDALFMPQFHSARDIHDAYYIKHPTSVKALEEPFASQVAQAHTDGGGTNSRGWQYTFDMNTSRRLLLRTQGTVLSARWLSQASVPGKYFAIARCFRPDQVDSTHAPDFFQCEGIVLGKSIDFVTLLGLLELFAVEVAKAEEVKFAPAYFPFTEPSVEVHIRHPEVGWMELGGAGIFRPEVTIPQGVDVPVIAWGLGLDRMAMMALEIDDIRDLFSSDLNKVRSTHFLMKD